MTAVSAQAMTWALRGVDGGPPPLRMDRARGHVGEHKVRAVLTVLADHHRPGRGSWPSRATIAREAAVDDFDVGHALGVLQHSGLIWRIRHARGPGHPAVWDLAIDESTPVDNSRNVVGMPTAFEGERHGQSSGQSSGERRGVRRGHAHGEPEPEPKTPLTPRDPRKQAAARTGGRNEHGELVGAAIDAAARYVLDVREANGHGPGGNGALRKAIAELDAGWHDTAVRWIDAGHDPHRIAICLAARLLGDANEPVPYDR